MPNVSLIDGHIDEQKKERPYDISPEPLWCEDCKHFCNADMGGEGMCDIDNHDTWYGCPICKKAELKFQQKKPTNYDRIRNMSVEEMAKFLEEFKKYRCSNCIYHYEKEPCFDKSCEIGLKQWLESEVTE